MIRVVSASWVLAGRGGGGVIPDGAVALDGDWIVAVGPRPEVEAQHGKAERRAAVLLPAFVNAHLHLELSHLAGEVPGGAGLPAWIATFVRTRARLRDRDPRPAMQVAARSLVRAGVAAVADISNTLASLEPLGAEGIAGTVFHEVFGLTRASFEAAKADLSVVTRAAAPPPPGIAMWLSPHALYSTWHPLLVELLHAGPGSLHLAEDPAERTFVSEARGGFADLVKRMGTRAEDVVPRARSPVALVAPHLRPHHLAVHCVDLDDEDVALLKASGATVVLCPRSNAYIGCGTPRLDALLAAGVPLAIGTDSLASAPSLSPLADAAALRRAFRGVPASRIVPLLWNGPAVGAPHVGALVPGRAPGVLAVPAGSTLVDEPYELLLSLGAEDGSLEWVSRQRSEVFS